MKLTTLVMQRLALRALALLASTQGPEVLCGLGYDVRVELHDDAPNGSIADLDVEERVWTRRRRRGLFLHLLVGHFQDRRKRMKWLGGKEGCWLGSIERLGQSRCRSKALEGSRK